MGGRGFKSRSGQTFFHIYIYINIYISRVNIYIHTYIYSIYIYIYVCVYIYVFQILDTIPNSPRGKKEKISSNPRYCALESE